MSFFVPGHEFDEARNKLEAFRLFAYADRELGFPADGPEPLNRLLRRAMSLSNYQSIWALEGIAHHFAAASLRKAPLCGMLGASELPERAMVPLHAGMGTALAESVFTRLGDQPSNATLGRAIEGFFENCRANARAGWYDNAIEPMGLVVRTLYPRLLMQVSHVVGEIDRAAQRLYWHGAGRSLYFVPTNFITFAGAHERALRSAISEAPTLEDRANTVAGLVWAVALVNIRHPAVLKNLLRAAAPFRMRDAVINGVISALMVWKHMIPGDTEFLPLYARYGGQEWNDQVVAPSARAFRETFPDLCREDRVASLFTYRDLL